MEQAKGKGLGVKWTCKAAAHIQVGAVTDNQGGAGLLMQGWLSAEVRNMGQGGGDRAGVDQAGEGLWMLRFKDRIEV